jgi:ribosome hibernation promoting factor
MKITYTGTQDELPVKQRAKFEAKLQKLSKMLERKGEKEAHVIVRKERFLNCVEITINAFDHSMAGAGSDGDLVTAMNDAIEKLEKQVIRLRSKWRDTKRHKDKESLVSTPEPAASKINHRPAPKVKARPPAREGNRKVPKVFPVDQADGRKPMTVEEAMIEMDPSQDYLVFRDAETERLTVLLRRADGNFDLIES